MDAAERNWAFRQLFYGEVLQELDAHFEKMSVLYMPIKGAYLICAGHAEKMRTRRMDDIDILVMPQDFERVCDYFLKLPNVKSLRDYWEFEKVLAYRISGRDCHVEIHFLINYPARFMLPTEELFERAAKSSGQRMMSSPEDALLICICHAFVHIGFELRETLFEELALLISQKGFRWDRFWDIGETTGAAGFAYLILKMCEGKYPVSIEYRRKYPYANVLSKLLRGHGLYDALPKWSRRLFIEAMFSRNPLQLLMLHLAKKFQA